MMFDYNIEALKSLLANIIQNNVPSDAWLWLSMQNDVNSITRLNTAFAAVQRKTGRALISINEEWATQLSSIRPGFNIKNWTADRLCRVWLLIQADATEKTTYFKAVENLYLAAEMHELVALYSALPLLPYAELWVKRCAEGIRSNIGIVLEAIMYHNPYPAQNLPEAAWNQLVMKAIFTEKQLDMITGLHQRNNPELARMLLDYARERAAAERAIEPMLWQLAALSNADMHNAAKQQYSTSKN